jgi:hypothetical protein
MVTPVDPNLLTGFTDSVYFCRANFSYWTYSYDLGGKSWICGTDDVGFNVAAKVLIGGILWLGGMDICKFITPAGLDRGTYLTIAEIEEDATDGSIRYSLQYDTSGNSAGGFVAYWNTTACATAALAWPANALWLLHGVGIEETATMNIGALLVSLLLLQLPDVPLLVNVLIAVPIWAGIVYIIWFLIKEMIPFV